MTGFDNLHFGEPEDNIPDPIGLNAIARKALELVEAERPENSRTRIAILLSEDRTVDGHVVDDDRLEQMLAEHGEDAPLPIATHGGIALGFSETEAGTDEFLFELSRHIEAIFAGLGRPVDIVQVPRPGAQG